MECLWSRRSVDGLDLMCLTQHEATQTMDHCESVLLGVISSIQNHYLRLRSLIEAHQEGAAAQLITSVQELETRIEELDQRRVQLDRLAESDNDVHFLQVS